MPLLDVPLEKSEYEADLEVASRYQAFSAELLRLSLAGIGVVGYLLKEVVRGGQSTAAITLSTGERTCVWAGVLALVVSATSALAHRYCVSECIASQIRYLRAKKLRGDVSQEEKPSKVAEIMATELTTYRWLLKISGPLLLTSSISLGVATLVIAFLFATYL